ncbi:unnamed protein product [Cylindrotheca closterium]|uniref:EamA domain-containing protein n=1 Tax=Cylindrotheca closterium TaxID=2856 RepID=A0AAD2CP88_9STRA|nr:unnamed protein product [Cylindrotheca closterium]
MGKTNNNKGPRDRQHPDESAFLLEDIEEQEGQQVKVAAQAPPLPTHRKVVSLFAGSNPHQRRTRPPRGGGRGGAHHRSLSSFSDMYHAVRDYPMGEDMRQVGDDIKSGFVHNMRELDQGKNLFLDMSMTRSLSVLPEDISDFAFELTTPRHKAEEEYEQEEEDEITKTLPPTTLFHYLGLFLAVFAVSSKATCFHMLDDVEAPLKQYWKMTATSVFLLPFAVHLYRNEGLPQLSLWQWITFMAAIVCYSVQAVLFVKALEYTTVGNACIYANSQALILILGKGCVGDPIHWLEGLGVFIAFSGAVLCTLDAESQSEVDNLDGTDGTFGDALAFLSAIAGVSYLTFAKSVRSGMSVTVFVFGVMFFGQLFVLLFMQLTSSSLEYNFDMDDGVFGWLNEHRLPIMIYLVLVVNSVGTMGFVRAMEHFDTLLIAVATLMEPLMASLIAFVFHAGLLPGPLGWVGNLLVVIGTLGVVYPSIGKGDGAMAH